MNKFTKSVVRTTDEPCIMPHCRRYGDEKIAAYVREHGPQPPIVDPRAAACRPNRRKEEPRAAEIGAALSKRNAA